MYTLKRDFIVGYFFHIAMANRGCTFGIATKAFNLITKRDSIHMDMLNQQS